jgi:hypothetical protein
MTDLVRLGIRIEALGDRLRYSPRSVVTPDLAERMKIHKGELLAVLRRDMDARTIDLTNATEVWRASLRRLEGDPRFPPNVMAALRVANAQWGDDLELTESDESIEIIAPPDPCSQCGTLELWQSMAGNWRCLQCDPPTASKRLMELRRARKHRSYLLAEQATHRIES